VQKPPIFPPEVALDGPQDRAPWAPSIACEALQSAASARAIWRVHCMRDAAGSCLWPTSGRLVEPATRWSRYTMTARPRPCSPPGRRLVARGWRVAGARLVASLI
jgi:hypothetical protein